jgi:hypothetical protein
MVVVESGMEFALASSGKSGVSETMREQARVQYLGG